MILFSKTSTSKQLAAIYSTADFLFNPTKEDNYPTVNLEAQMCGTPFLSYDVGGCAETRYLQKSRIVKTPDEAIEEIVKSVFRDGRYQHEY